MKSFILRFRGLWLLIGATLISSGCAMGKSYVASPSAGTSGAVTFNKQPYNPSINLEQPPGTPPIARRLIVYNSNVHLEVKSDKDFEPTIKTIRETAEKMGGFMQGLSERSITVKVPADQFAVFFDELSKLGEIDKKEISGSDVTDRYRDLMIRLDNAQKARERYLKLLESATSVADAVAVEKELERVTEQVELLKADLRNITQDLQFATITVYLQERVMPGPLGWIFYGAGWFIYHLFVWD